MNGWWDAARQMATHPMRLIAGELYFGRFSFDPRVVHSTIEETNYDGSNQFQACLSECIRFGSNMSSAFKYVKLVLQFMPGTDVSMEIEDQLAKHAVTAEEAKLLGSAGVQDATTKEFRSSRRRCPHVRWKRLIYP